MPRLRKVICRSGLLHCAAGIQSRRKFNSVGTEIWHCVSFVVATVIIIWILTDRLYYITVLQCYDNFSNNYQRRGNRVCGYRMLSQSVVSPLVIFLLFIYYPTPHFRAWTLNQKIFTRTKFCCFYSTKVFFFFFFFLNTEDSHHNPPSRSLPSNANTRALFTSHTSLVHITPSSLPFPSASPS